MPTALSLLSPSRPFCLMGVVNVTPDSFYPGSRVPDPHAAVDRAGQMIEEGAEIIDVGGESSRPGAALVSAQEEMSRILPVIRELRRQKPALHISVDTMKPEVARAALEAGADFLNDIGGGADPAMLRLATECKAFLCLMHMQGRPGTMQQDPRYGDVATEVKSFLHARAAAAEAAGVAREKIIIDPGIGFGKTLEHNLALFRSLAELTALPYPVLLGASRKSFIDKISPASPERRLAGSLAAVATAWRQGIRFFRVHDVYETRQFLQVFSKITES